MTVACWNILGLILSLFGVLLLFSLTPACADPRGMKHEPDQAFEHREVFLFLVRYGMPYRVRTGGTRALIAQGTDEATSQEERRYALLGGLGVALIVLGTISQIMANL